MRWWGQRSKTETTAAAPPAEARSLADPSAEFLELFGATPAASGVSVNATTALRVPAFAAAVATISGTVGTLPAKLFIRLDGGGKEVDADHPAHALTHRSANPWTSAGALREAVTRDALTHDKGGFALVVRAGGLPREIHRLPPAAVTVEFDQLSGEPSYVVAKKGGGTDTYGFGDVIHIVCPGGSPVTRAREALGLSLILERHAAKLFANGARPGGILRFPGKLGAETARRIKASWQAAFGGDNTGSTAVLEEDGQYQALSLTSVDAQFAEMRGFQILEISRATGVPPTFLSDLSRATWANSAELNRAFLQYCLLGWLRQWEAGYRRTLLSADEQSDRTVEFVVDDLLRADIGTRAEAYTKMIAARVMTPNEARARENLPAHPDGDTLSNPNITTTAPAGGTDGN